MLGNPDVMENIAQKVSTDQFKSELLVCFLALLHKRFQLCMDNFRRLPSVPESGSKLKLTINSGSAIYLPVKVPYWY